MKLIVSVASALALLLGVNAALAATQEQEDEERFQSLFSAAELYAPRMRQCGMAKSVEKMIWSLAYLDHAYSKLNKFYEAADPPIAQQVEERIEIVCRAVQCNDPPRRGSCESEKSFSAMTLKRFSRAVEDAKRRLAKAGLNQEIERDAKPQIGGCPLSPQQYEDAYRKSFRISDLLCMQESLKRHYGLN